MSKPSRNAASHAATDRRAIVAAMTSADPVAPDSSATTLPLEPRLRRILFTAVFLVALALRTAYVFEIWPHPAARFPSTTRALRSAFGPVETAGSTDRTRKSCSAAGGDQ